MEGQREQETEEATELRREESRKRMALFRQNERQQRHDPLTLNTASNNTYSDSNIVTHFCGELNVICQKCQAKHLAGEKPSDGLFINCCHKGKFIPPLRRKFPLDLRSLLSNPADPH